MIELKKFEVWFITGSQELYSQDVLYKVAEHSQEIAKAFSHSSKIPIQVKFKPVLTSPDAIYKLCLEANAANNCIGLIIWMHTFSPAKMWIAGLNVLQKPFVHLHTQFNRDLPWDKIDMDFMNLNQSAHGDREFGYICTRMNKARKVIVGHWKEEKVHEKLAIWMRAALARLDAQNGKIARFGDNMREVAVTDGDKVEAQIKLGYSVNTHAVGELVAYVNAVSNSEINSLLEEYEQKYIIVKELCKGGERHQNLIDAAKIEIGLKTFLKEGKFNGFTTNFQDLYGLTQLPGLAVQRLMAEGYGFGAEGDWKTSALVRAMKIMSIGLEGGTSFMEDYTYHLDPSGMKVLGAHMLEVCESLHNTKPHMEIHPLFVGGKDDPPRLIFNAPIGPAINVTIVDMGNRFRMIVNDINVVSPDIQLPKLPVARAIWVPKPSLEIAAHAWILAGGAHHFSFSQSITSEYMEDFAEMVNIEYLMINDSTSISEFKKELRWNDVYYSLKNGM
ncbi:MAG: L-arabinose isomerase [Ignavibacteriaceae bacterium]